MPGFKFETKIIEPALMVIYLMISFVSIIGRYDYNASIALIGFLFVNLKEYNQKKIYGILVFISCILDIVWLSTNQNEFESLNSLKVFTYVLCAINLIVKIGILLHFLLWNKSKNAYKEKLKAKQENGLMNNDANNNNDNTSVYGDDKMSQTDIIDEK
mmetsp:Transcript_4176/g.5227  ORF Transcript_4176/g.5227 Transcript_4176/m.5227 type:complete len:158 (+) Transcript_4176:64-537(+)